MPEIVRSRDKMLARAGPILRRLQGIPAPIMVEVGVSTGLMAQYLLETRGDLEWHGVDPWRGNRDQPAPYVRTGDVHAQLTREEALEHKGIAFGRVRPFGERALIHHTTSVEAAERFGPLTADLVFLDGDHSYEGVKADIEAWWPTVICAGWIGGHDYKNPNPRFRFGVEKAVDEWVAEVGLPLELDSGVTWFVRKP